MVQKWAENYTKFTKFTQNWPKLAKNDQELINNWPNWQEMATKKWPKVTQKLDFQGFSWHILQEQEQQGQKVALRTFASCGQKSALYIT